MSLDVDVAARILLATVLGYVGQEIPQRHQIELARQVVRKMLDELDLMARAVDN